MHADKSKGDVHRRVCRMAALDRAQCCPHPIASRVKFTHDAVADWRLTGMGRSITQAVNDKTSALIQYLSAFICDKN